MESKIFRDFNMYEIFPDGKVLSLHTKKYLNPTKDKEGYCIITLYRRYENKKRKKLTIRLHRVIAECFIENPKNKPEVNHKNFITYDNRVENLEWCTRKENQQHFNDNIEIFNALKLDGVK